MAESVQITSAALAALLRADIPVSLLGWSGQFLGGFLPATNAHGLARLRQYQRTLDPAFALEMAGRVVTAKLYNQRRVLQRLAAARAGAGEASTLGSSPHKPAGCSDRRGLLSPPAWPKPLRRGEGPALSSRGGEGEGSGAGEFREGKAREGVSGNSPPSGKAAAPASIASNEPQSPSGPRAAMDETLRWLEALFASVSRSQSIDELRGYEGASSARYFQAWAGFLPSEFPFERRSTRPPLNPVNACISFGATLVYHEAVACLHARGLDPALGLLHTTEDGRWSLALDLMEPFRPALVEALALDLFSHQMLGAEHFEPKNGGVYLNDGGRRKFILQYERRMERQFMSECAGHRTSLRQQLEKQGIMFKAALDDPGKFEPFLMN
jgi:CRISPR/Cas system-associated endonuclease Cas1